MHQLSEWIIWKCFVLVCCLRISPSRDSYKLVSEHRRNRGKFNLNENMIDQYAKKEVIFHDYESPRRCDPILSLPVIVILKIIQLSPKIVKNSESLKYCRYHILLVSYSVLMISLLKIWNSSSLKKCQKTIQECKEDGTRRINSSPMKLYHLLRSLIYSYIHRSYSTEKMSNATLCNLYYLSHVITV